MSDKDHRRHNHYHFGFFLVAAIALATVFAFSGERAADQADAPGKADRAFMVARAVSGFIAAHWWVVPVALLPFWLIHFLYCEWRFLKHVYHIALVGMGVGFLILYFQLDKRILGGW